MANHSYEITMDDGDIAHGNDANQYERVRHSVMREKGGYVIPNTEPNRVELPYTPMFSLDSAYESC